MGHSHSGLLRASALVGLVLALSASARADVAAASAGEADTPSGLDSPSSSDAPKSPDDFSTLGDDATANALGLCYLDELRGICNGGKKGTWVYEICFDTELCEWVIINPRCFPD